MIEESAVVIDIEGDTLVLQAQRKTSCQSCSVQKGCGTSVLSQWLGKKASIFRVQNTSNSKIGDHLVVGVAESSILKGSFLVYLLPLITLMTGAAFAENLLDAEMVGRDLWVFCSAIISLVVGVLLTRVRLSRQMIDNLSPVILRKDIEHGRLPPLVRVGK